MKKIIALILTLSLLLTALVGCSGDPAEDEDPREPPETQEKEGPDDSSNEPEPSEAVPSEADRPDETGEEIPPQRPYDTADPDAILNALSEQLEAAAEKVKGEGEAVLDRLDTYEEYTANKTAIETFYSDTIEASQALYADLDTLSVDFFKAVAARGLEDYDTWNGALDEYYDAWNDGMDAYYEVWNDYFDALYEKCDDLISDASDELSYGEYSDTWSEMYETYSDAWSNLYEAHSDAWSRGYERYTDIFGGFYDGDTDVDAILTGARSDPAYEAIRLELQKEVEGSLDELSAQASALTASVDSYASYKTHSGEISAFYGKVNEVSETMCLTLYDYCLRFADQVLSSGKTAGEMRDDLDVIYDCIYDGAGDDLYDGIYDGILDDLYDAFYDGALDDRGDIPYAEWAEARSGEYSQWTGARSDFYALWSQTRSDIYSFWSDIRGELWSKDIDGAREKTEDLRKTVEEMKNNGFTVTGEEAPADTAPEETDAGPEIGGEAEDTDVSVLGVRPEFKESMDEIESFYRDYVDFMKRYAESTDPISMLSDYMSMLDRLEEVQTTLSELDPENMSTAESLYYAQVMLRISSMLSELS